MKVQGTSTTGYCLSDMDDDDLRSLLSMINGTGLVERRHWNHIKRELETLLRDKQ